jgi:hypothetical protein
MDIWGFAPVRTKEEEAARDNRLRGIPNSHAEKKILERGALAVVDGLEAKMQVISNSNLIASQGTNCSEQSMNRSAHWRTYVSAAHLTEEDRNRVPPPVFDATKGEGKRLFDAVDHDELQSVAAELAWTNYDIPSLADLKNETAHGLYRELARRFASLWDGRSTYPAGSPARGGAMKVVLAAVVEHELKSTRSVHLHRDTVQCDGLMRDGSTHKFSIPAPKTTGAIITYKRAFEAKMIGGVLDATPGKAAIGRDNISAAHLADPDSPFHDGYRQSDIADAARRALHWQRDADGVVDPDPGIGLGISDEG